MLVYALKMKPTGFKDNNYLLTKSNKGHSSACKIVLDKLMQLENNGFKVQVVNLII